MKLSYRNETLFANAMTNGPAKVSAMVFSTVTALVMTPLIYTVIVYDYNTHNRTLINHLLASLMACGMFWNLVMQPITFLRYIAGPVDSALLCSLDTLLRNSICMHGLFLLDSMIIVRYIFMFHLKNPTALQVSISTTFYKQLFHLKVFCEAFFYLLFGFVTFWQHNITKKSCS